MALGIRLHSVSRVLRRLRGKARRNRKCCCSRVWRIVRLSLGGLVDGLEGGEVWARLLRRRRGGYKGFDMHMIVEAVYCLCFVRETRKQSGMLFLYVHTYLAEPFGTPRRIHYIATSSDWHSVYDRDCGLHSGDGRVKSTAIT